MSLTVAIPTYNRAGFLDKNLSYLFEQKESFTKVLVNDNASTDNTNEVIKKWKDKGLNINYNVNPENLGWAKNFELCFKNCDTKYVIVLGDDDFMTLGSLPKINELITKDEPDLVFLRALATKKDDLNIRTNVQFEEVSVGQFLTRTMLQFRLLSSYVINMSYYDESAVLAGNFAHLHVVLNCVKEGSKFFICENKLVGTYPNNSSFVHKVNFSDVYVTEFLELFRSYLESKISDTLMQDIEKIMLRKYYPKLILKSRYGKIKKDEVYPENFEKTLSNNEFYKSVKSLYLRDDLLGTLYMIYLLLMPYKTK